MGLSMALICLWPAGCAQFESGVQKADAFAASPQGEAVLSDVTATALTAGVDYATGNELGAGLAGVQGAASLIRPCAR